MFIPHGATIHESLATSFVLVDALVADLCEGGFSGVVEVVLRDTDSFVVIASGAVAAVIEKRGGHAGTGPATQTRTTVEELAQRSRGERGRVSVHSYSTATASAVAGRLNAQPLYVGLSTEFANLEKMISKLVREPDREWFIEIDSEGGPSALIHICDGECRIIGSSGDTNSGALDLTSNPALGNLIDQCAQAGSVFDVYFRLASATRDGPVESSRLTPETSRAEASPLLAAPIEPEPKSRESAASVSLLATGLSPASGQEPERFTLSDSAATGLQRQKALERSSDAAVASAAGLSLAPHTDGEARVLAEDPIEPQAGDLSVLWGELPPTADDAEAMAEIKRLMSEIARAIEQAAQAVGRPDGFSMALRAGQLKIADRFPFLDPFAGDFEYLAGEIVFVGHAPPEEFVDGLTEALKLAIEAVTRSTAYADRFRSYVNEDLRKLLAREQAAFERLGLDHVIQRLATF